MVPGAAVLEVVQRQSLLPQQLYGWRRELDAGSAASPVLESVIVEPPFDPLSQNQSERPCRKRAAA
ncbi:transposase [Aurantimonas sp. NFXS3]